MSLTSHLKDKQSPVRQFIHDRFPNTRALTKDASTVLKEAPTTRPDGPENIPSTIGGAIDYRARYFFPVVASRSLVAWGGARRAASLMIDGVDAIPQVSADNADANHAELDGNLSSLHPSGGIVSEFFENLDSFLATAKPAGKQLDRDSEKTLARYCYVLALFEEVYRAGPWPTSILFRKQYQSVEELLCAIPSQSVNDIAELSNIFYHRFEPHFGEPVTLNPTFEGSRDVSGADGDLILSQCLIDFKATVNPRMSPEWLRQLVGYVLLDYSDMHHLDSVGIYLVRQDVLLRWPLDDFIQKLSDEKTGLSSLRQEFRTVTQSG